MQTEGVEPPGERGGRLRKLRRALVLRIWMTPACGRDEAFLVVGFSPYRYANRGLRGWKPSKNLGP
jgi:hypothetical protein